MGAAEAKVLSKNATLKRCIFAGIYSPPNYKKNNELQTHLTSRMHHWSALHKKVEQIFPQKSVRISNQDVPFITA